MLIAKQKRKENIAEYILYIWQIEDLLRVWQLDADTICRNLVDPLALDENKKQEVFFWYIGIVNLLKEEQKESLGHNYHSLHVIRELNDVHLYLLKKDTAYSALYAACEADLADFRTKSNKPNTSDIEIAFDALYAKLVLTRKKITLSDHTQEAFTRITQLVAYLSTKFHRFENGLEAMTD